MTFTNNLFLIGLLPWFVILYNIGKRKQNLKTTLLIAANILFYLWGGIGAFLFLICYSFFVFLFANLIQGTKNNILFIISIVLAILPLVAVKYVDGIIMPIGISFFTFEAISLLYDVYKKSYKQKVSFKDTFLYLSFFPTVTSGPIIRFNEFRNGLLRINYETDYNKGIERIIIGLCKKVLIADKIALVADYYFNGVASGNSFSSSGLWIGSIAYTLQLYFDFSGYSDMAIGIGDLLGFSIRENFNKPYLASSISDFWKRWHISLSQWFRDYVYIPLGGNRCSIPKHIFNLFTVWILTGIWHGADFSFIIWGIGYFLLLSIEKYIPFMKKIGNHWWGHLYTLFFINLLWVPFRAENTSVAISYLSGMFSFTNSIAIETKALNYIPYLIIASFFCLPWSNWVTKYKNNLWLKQACRIVLIILAGLAICAVINASYTPYIYGKF